MSVNASIAKGALAADAAKASRAFFKPKYKSLSAKNGGDLWRSETGPVKQKSYRALSGARVAGAVGAGSALVAGVGGAGFAAGKKTNKKSAITKNDSGSMMNAFGISKADWKNIEQRKIDSRNARRGKRQGAQAVGIGAAVAGAGAGAGGVSAAKAFADRGKNSYKTSQVFSPNAPKSLHLQNAARTVGRSIKLSPKSAIAAGATVGGAALAAGGAAKFGVGLGKEKHAEKKIAQMRKQRALKVSKVYVNEFGISKGFLSNKDKENIKRTVTPTASVSRLATGTFAPGIHGAVAGKKGKKLKAVGHELVGATAGVVGGAVGTEIAHRKGYYKKDNGKIKVSKSFAGGFVSAFGVTHEGISKADIPTQEGYKKAKLASAGKNNVQVRRGTYGKRMKGRLKDQVPAMAVDAAATGGQLALMRKSPKTALAVGTASLGASYGLTVRGAKRSANREIKNKDIVVTDKKTGKKAIGTGYLGHKFE